MRLLRKMSYSHKSNVFLLLLVTLACQACTIKTTNIDYDYRLDNSEQDDGIVVMSLSASGTTALSLRARNKSNDNIVFPMFSEHGAPGVDWHNPSGRLMAVRLPAGKYTFYEFFAYDVKPKDGQIYSYTYANKEPFSVTFNVEPGKTVYAGNLYIDLNSENTVQVLNRKDRDIGLFLQRFKNISEEEIVIKLASLE